MSSQGLADVLKDVAIPVEDPNVSEAWLQSAFGEERVKRSRRIWHLLTSKVRVRPIQQRILACGSPQRGWFSFEEFYTAKKEEERGEMERACYGLEQRVDEKLLDACECGEG